MNIWRIAIGRLLLGLVILFLVSLLIFFATNILPGDAARAILGRTATEESLRALRAQLHLDAPLAVQYGRWLTGIFTGDFGISLANRAPVADIILPKVRNSATLLFFVAILGVPLSIVLAVLAATRWGRRFDNIVSVLALSIAAIPEFVVGIALVILLATVVFPILPPVSMVKPGAAVLGSPRILVLPALTLIIVIFPYIFRMVRASMIEVLESEYIEMAKLKGLSTRRILWLHAMPNAIAPGIQVVALTLAYLAGGVVIIEYLFGFPGIGQALIDAIRTRDVPVIQTIVLLLAAIYIALNIVADIGAILVTPKLWRGTWQTK